MYQLPSSLLRHVKFSVWGTKRIWNRNLQTKIAVSHCAPHASILHVAKVKKDVGTFRIGKLFYSL